MTNPITAQQVGAVKKCITCDKAKPLADFSGRGNGQRRPACNACRSASRRARGESARRRAAETPQETRTRILWEQYRLTVQQYEAIFAAQNGLCVMCQTPPKVGRPLVVDHCHSSGVVRALLCMPCNVAVGFYEKHRDAARQYLAVYGSGNPLLAS
jgi:Autographiviridae endonuclease VII